MQTVGAYTGSSFGYGGPAESIRGYSLGDWNLYADSHSSYAKINKKVHLGPFKRITVSGFGYWTKRGTRGTLWINLSGGESAHTDYAWRAYSSDSDYYHGFYKNACAVGVSIDVSYINDARGISLRVQDASSGNGPGPILITSIRFDT